MKKMIVLLFTIILFSPLTPNVSAGVSFYIDPSSTNTDSPDGSIEKPFKTWDDIPWVAGSTYLQKRGTTCAAARVIKPTVDDITLGAYGTGERPIIKSMVGDRAKAIEFSKSRIVIQDLEIYSTNDIVCAILLGGTGPHVVDNCVLHDCSWGMRIFNLTGKLTISNCEIYDIGDDGIFTQNTEDIEIFGCNIHHVNADLPERATAGGDCIQITGEQGYLHIHDNILDHSAFGRKFCLIIGSAYEDRDAPHEALVENNVMIGYYDEDEVTSAIYVKKSIEHLTFRYNIVDDAATGTWLNADAMVHSNLFTNCNEGVTINSGKTVKVFNNTFVNNYNGIGSNYGSTGYIFNNIFARGDYTKTYITLYGDITSDYNCFSEERTGIFNGYDTLEEWRDNQNRDIHSLVGDPEFVNSTNEDFHIKSTSVCKDNGKPLDEITQDIEGVQVPLFDGPDIGAYEYSNGAPTPEAITLQAEDFFSMKGVGISETYIKSCDKGDWVCFSDVDLGSGFTRFTTNAALAYGTAKYIEIRVGGPTGILIGTHHMQPTGGWTEFEEQSTMLSGGEGIQDIYLCFKGGYGVGNFDWFKFSN